MNRHKHPGPLPRSLAVLFFGLCLLVLPTPGAAARISVLSLLKPTTVRMSVDCPRPVGCVWDDGTLAGTVMRPNDGEMSVRLEGQKLSFGDGTAGKIAVRCPSRCAFHLVLPGKISRTYRGSLLTLQPLNSTISIVLDDRNEPLSSSILRSEMAGMEGAEALKALAVLIRTFLVSPPRHPDIGADFCDTTHCQVFQGAAPNSRILSAVSGAAGMVLSWRGKPFRPFYSTLCGGRTATFRDVWGDDSPDYPFYSVRCEPCAKAANRRWTASLTPAQLAKTAGFVVEQLKHDGGRIELSGKQRGQMWSPENFRILVGRQLGWNILRSNAFEVRPCGASFCFEGTGRGHRVGLCQYGAGVMARSGATYREILNRYFPETEIALDASR